MERPPSSDIAFTDAVKHAQSRLGSRAAFERLEARGGHFRTQITPDLVAFLREVDTAYLATANRDGQPYAQHRGGPPGFIRAVDPTTLGFADFAGNRQYVTVGNLSENDRAFLFLMDYAQGRRVKLWGRARVVEDDPALIAQLAPENYPGRAERAILFRIEAWDANCAKHIPQKLNASDVAAAFEQLQDRVATLEAETKRLRAELAAAHTQVSS